MYNKEPDGSEQFYVVHLPLSGENAYVARSALASFKGLEASRSHRFGLSSNAEMPPNPRVVEPAPLSMSIQWTQDFRRARFFQTFALDTLSEIRLPQRSIGSPTHRQSSNDARMSDSSQVPDSISSDKLKQFLGKIAPEMPLSQIPELSFRDEKSGAVGSVTCSSSSASWWRRARAARSITRSSQPPLPL